VLWCSELQCGDLASREFVSDVMACRHGSLVVSLCVCVCVCRGCYMYQVYTGWVGLDGKWGRLCVCFVSI
jgi:hypothetical protein